MSKFKYSVGPWNVHEGADAYGPATRETIPFEEKLKKFKEIGFDAIQFHDDDVVPNINNYTDAEIEFRVKRTIPIWSEYVNESCNVVQHCILNNGSRDDLYKQVDNLIEYYN